ncbi:MAG: hypothetical protein KME47_10030 [Nodosilinea sp. WJT8-NPBG4]|jgi:hypothetical protein|nr:hypothetical protein [Nodosilinea sp. WJT8-NPBG4]
MTYSDEGKERYGKEWPKTRKQVNGMLRHQCTLCGAEALNVHHAYYGKRGLFGHTPEPDLEVPGWSVFPLCLNHHSRHKGMAHHPDNYKWSDAHWTNSNTQDYLFKLRLHFWLKYCLLGLTEVLVGFVCVFILCRLFLGLLQ